MLSHLHRVLQSFSWLKRPYQWLLVLGLLATCIALGLWAYSQPLHYRLIIGGADVPMVRGALSRSSDSQNPERWLHDKSSIVVAGISSSYPVTLSILTGGQYRPDVAAGDVVSFTITVNGHTYPDKRMFPQNRWYRWRIDQELISQGKLDIEFHIPDRKGGWIIWPIGMTASRLLLDPVIAPNQSIAPFAELDWRNVAYLAVIALLVYSFFAGVRQRWLMLLGLFGSLLLAFALATLLRNNRPMFVAYASSLALALFLVRLILPLFNFGRVSRYPALWLLLLSLGVGLLFANPDFTSGDDIYKYLTTESMMLRGTLKLPAPQTDAGSSYSRYALGHSVATIPLLATALTIQQISDAPDAIRYFFVMLLDPIVIAITVLLLFLCTRRLFGNQQLAIAIALIYFFATYALPYAVQSWSEPLAGMLLLLTFYSMLRVFAPEESNPQRWLLVAGFALGYLLFTKEEYVLVAAIFGIWWLLRRGYLLCQQLASWRGSPSTLFFEGLRLLVPMLTFYLANLGYNFVRSGDLFTSGYNQFNIQFNTPPFVGLYGLLLSPGKGLLIFAPPVLLCLWAVSSFWQHWGWETALICVLFAQGLLFYSLYQYWEGGICWGPRFLLPYLPLLMLFSSAALKSWAQWRKWQHWAYAGLVLVGGIVAVIGISIPPNESWGYGITLDLKGWASQTPFSPLPLYSPIVHAWKLFWLGYIQPMSMFQLSYYHFPAVADHLVPGLLIALIGVAALQVSRIYTARPASADVPYDQLPANKELVYAQTTTSDR